MKRLATASLIALVALSFVLSCSPSSSKRNIIKGFVDLCLRGETNAGQGWQMKSSPKDSWLFQDDQTTTLIKVNLDSSVGEMVECQVESGRLSHDEWKTGIKTHFGPQVSDDELVTFRGAQSGVLKSVGFADGEHGRLVVSSIESWFPTPDPNQLHE